MADGSNRSGAHPRGSNQSADQINDGNDHDVYVESGSLPEVSLGSGHAELADHDLHVDDDEDEAGGGDGAHGGHSWDGLVETESKRGYEPAAHSQAGRAQARGHLQTLGVYLRQRGQGSLRGHRLQVNGHKLRKGLHETKQTDYTRHITPTIDSAYHA